MTDTSHLAALETRLSHERAYLSQATKTSEIELRKVWIVQIEREIAAEIAFLAKHGVVVRTANVDDANISDDDLLSMLAE